MKQLRNFDIGTCPVPCGDAEDRASARDEYAPSPPLPPATTGEADRADALEALRLVLNSDEFRASQQLSAFLTFSVGRTLEGRGATLKAYTIATEVFRRGSDFDPQIDPIVRVEATRLRRALERYYGGGGADHPLRIVLPRGSYAVSFERRGSRSATAATAGTPDEEAITPHATRGIRGRFPWKRVEDSGVAMRSAVGALVLGLSIWIAMPQTESKPETAFLIGKSPGHAERTVPAAVAVAVVAGDHALDPLAEDLRDALAARPRFAVSALPDAFRAEAADGVLVTLRAAGPSEAPRIVVRVMAARDGLILWTSSFPQASFARDRASLIDAVADKIAADEAIRRFGSRSAGSTTPAVDRPS